MYYPGDDYVDIVALDVYVDDPVISFSLTFFYDYQIDLF
jgi:beta-mannanase